MMFNSAGVTRRRIACEPAGGFALRPDGLGRDRVRAAAPGFVVLLCVIGSLSVGVSVMGRVLSERLGGATLEDLSAAMATVCHGMERT